MFHHIPQHAVQQGAKMYNFCPILTKYGSFEDLHIEIFVQGVKSRGTIDYLHKISYVLYRGMQNKETLRNPVFPISASRQSILES